VRRAQAILFDGHGGPEVLKAVEIDVPDPGPGEALVRQSAIGVNFIDTYHRTGLYPVPSFPSGLGVEAAGTVEAVGPDVDTVKPGDRVAYAPSPVGAYASLRVMPADRLVPLPPDVADEVAAAVLLKGMTAEYLLRRTYAVRPGETVLVHAAAGGVGLLLCQWARHLGCRVIGTVGSDEKAALAAAHGCDHPIVYTREDFVARVRELTGGRGVPVVYDSVGRATFEGSLDCLSPRGTLALFGQASGKVQPFDPGVLAAKGSLFLTRPTLHHYVASRSDLLATAAAVFDVVRSGAVKVRLTGRYPLAEAARAHRDLEARKTTGSLVLV
jgi:NADPH2:quinone reductase